MGNRLSKIVTRNTGDILGPRGRGA